MEKALLIVSFDGLFSEMLEVIYVICIRICMRTHIHIRMYTYS